MRVLVAGATSVPGIPLLRELNARGHEVIGVTRSSGKTAQISAEGAKPVVADVLDAGQIDAVLAEFAPEAVVSLLTTLPKWGPKRPKDFGPATELWSRGAPNLVAAAQRAGVHRVVAESVIFAYGYGADGPPLIDESDPYPGPPPPHGAEFLEALRGMERSVLSSGEHSGTEGIVLRYGVFYGPGGHPRRTVPPPREVVGPAGTDRSGNPVLGTHRRRRPRHCRRARQGPGRADLQHRRRPATVLRRLRQGAEPQAAPTAAGADLAPSGRAAGLLPGDRVRSGVAAAVQRESQGRARLDAYSPVNWGGRFWNIAVTASARSFDGRNAEFHAATYRRLSATLAVRC